MPPTLYVLRHGETDLNAQDRLRGWLNPPLNSAGQRQAERLAERLKDVSFRWLVTSNLIRARQTAEAIRDANQGKMVLVPTYRARPWNIGDLAGQRYEDVKDDVLKYMRAPETAPPRGEPYATFYQRWRELLGGLLFLATSVPKAAVGVITHTRNLAAIRSILTDGEESIPTESKEGTGHGVRLVRRDKGWELTEI